MTRYKARRWATGVAISALTAGASVLHAQEIVQPLPPAGSSELNAALQRLSRNDNDVSALLDAGDAALKLGDVPAAIGFFGRAQALSPSNPRISLGLGRAYTLSRRPVEALRLFAEAERGGIPLRTMAAERAVAFDLVGDAASAQDLYRLALASGENETVRRNLALSQAISGDKAGFEATLLPLLQKGDNAAFRTRAFGLAVLGETDAAVKIARDMMPAAAAAQIEPYLRYMTQLTPAQQAAAGVLGVFPRSAAMGQDDAQIAAYTPGERLAVRTSDSALEPQGEPLGSPNPEATPRRQSQREARRSSRASRIAAPAPSEAPRQNRRQELPAVSPSGELPPVERDLATRPVDLGTQPAVVSPPPPPPPSPPAPPPPPPQRQDISEAFAGFELAPPRSTAPRAGAVDITAIEAPRERDEPPAPVLPERYWVQLATGRDISALGFDWRRIGRDAGGLLAGKNGFTAPWGEANRLLAGPYDSAAQARETVNRLKAAGVDSFPFTSARGEEVFALPGAKAAPAGPPAPPAHPARHWVQVATGKDREALAFDWRRIVRNAEGELSAKAPHVARWGAANRLLAGPYDSPQAARDAVNRLKAMGIDSFPFTSEAGEAIEPLG